MQTTQTLNFVKFTACMVLVIGLSARASASCGDSLAAMAAAAASVHSQSSSQSSPMQQGTASSSDGAVNPSIVGLSGLEHRRDRDSQPKR